MDNKEFIYHLIDWGLAILLAILPLIQNKYYLIGYILLGASSVSIYLLVRENIKIKRELRSYEFLLDAPQPFYTLLNYIHKQNSVEEKYKNPDVSLDDFCLRMQYVNTDVPGKCDVRFTWTFVGINKSNYSLGKFYLHIAGGPPTPLEKLNVICLDCTIRKNICNFKDSAYNCTRFDHCYAQNRAEFSAVASKSSPTLYLLDINLSNKIHPNEEFTLKVSYVWPQCMDKDSDFVFVDPLNHARAIERVRLAVEVDRTVVKKETMIHVYSVDRTSGKAENEGQMRQLSVAGNSIYEKKFRTDPNKLYLVTIRNSFN